MKTTVAILASFLLASLLPTKSLQAQTVVCAETRLGEICMELLESEAPQTTANFLGYVDSANFDATIIHKSETGTNTAIEAGAYIASLEGLHVEERAPVPNEYSLANLRGTVSMVTVAGNINSGTSEWRINVSDNPSLDAVGTRATVFARIIGNGMEVVDVISRLPTIALPDTMLNTVPLLRMDSRLTADDLLGITKVFRYPGSREDYENELANGGPDEEIILTDVVCMESGIGEFCMELFSDTAPLTVANFLSYVRSGRFDGTFFHRAIPGFVAQTGGYILDPASGPVEIRKDGNVINEFSRSNLPGTVAMAKLGDDPNSANSEWFINLNDNSENLDNQNGGFTVFGQIIPSDIPVVELVVRQPIVNLVNDFGGAFSEVPLLRVDGSLSIDDFVIISRAFETQRDVSEGTGVDPDDPLAAIRALGDYSFSRFSIPVRYRGNIYQMIFRQNNSLPGFVFEVLTTQIIQLKDIGQPVAEFTDDMLTVPSIRAGQNVFTNLTFQLTNVETLEFTLQSWTRL